MMGTLPQLTKPVCAKGSYSPWVLLLQTCSEVQSEGSCSSCGGTAALDCSLRLAVYSERRCSP